MKDVYLINWWIPCYERETRFYSANKGINKKTLEACASNHTMQNNKHMIKGVKAFEKECKGRFGLTQLNIKPTHDEYNSIENMIKHYERFIKQENIIDIRVEPPPMND